MLISEPKQPALKLKRKWFNPLYFILNEIVKDPTIRTVFVYGGKSSSKTVSISQILSKEAFVKGDNTIAFRKESSTIQTTLKKSFNLAIKSMRLKAAFETLLFMYRCIKGSEIVLKGLDSEEKAKGIESYKYVYLDELNHFEKEEYEQFNLSLRGIPGQKLFASWNPVSETSWIKTDVLDNYTFTDTDAFGSLPAPDSSIKISDNGKIILIKTTYPDNYWIVGSPCGTYGYRDENLIEEYESLKARNFNSYRVNVKGEWGKVQTGSEYAHKFDKLKHVKKVSYDPSLPIHLTLDFNAIPYMTGLCAQLDLNAPDGRKKLRFFREYCLPPPRNTTEDICSALESEFGHRMRGLFFYGDPSGRNRQTVSKQYRDNFDVIAKKLHKYLNNYSDRVLRSHPDLLKSRDFLNDLLAGTYGIDVEIDESCVKLIEDLEYAKQDANGGVLKTMVKDKDTKESYQKYGHTSDAFRYLVVPLFENIYES